MKKIMLPLILCIISFKAYAVDTTAYDACYKSAKDDDEVALCMKAQTARVLKVIQEIYQNIAKHPDLAKWNNGTGLISGNLKDMYNHWVNYRNRYCSLYKVANKNNFGSENFHYERCLLSMTQRHYENIHSIIIDANTGGEEDD